MKVYGNNQVGKYGAVPWPTGGCSLYTITPESGQLRPISYGEWVLEFNGDLGQGVDDAWLDLVPAYVPPSNGTTCRYSPAPTTYTLNLTGRAEAP